ncbi:DUF1430 domain-containing protein [Levyella massiliensis]|uniref:DUF1430 domain-containing protein n=1 Tax=Levyella massiliensis TaxID=938289 RepID=UPI0023F152A1|nr:DUF1430 domain-containing protein [Levyella massiliensis]
MKNKRLFFSLLFSTLAISLLVLTMIFYNQRSHLYSSFPSVRLQSVKQEKSWEDVSSTLERIAEENKSILARRILVASLSEDTFKYVFFGTKETPAGFLSATEKEIEDADRAGSVIIYKGGLSQKKLAEEMASLSNEPIKITPHPFIFVRVIRSFSSAVGILFFGLLLLLFIAVEILDHLRDLPAAGIRLISGIRASSLFLKNIEEDLLAMAFAGGIGFLIANSIMVVFRFWHITYMNYVGAAILLYLGMVFLVGLLLHVLFLCILQSSRLVDLVKGKVPAKSILVVLLLGQAVAMFVVGFGVDRSRKLVPATMRLIEAKADWAKRKQYVNLTFSDTALSKDANEQKRRDAAWFSFIEKALQQRETVFVKNEMGDFIDINPSGNSEQERKIRDLRKRLLYVSPSYFEAESISLDEKVRSTINNLEQGEFALLVPKSLVESTEDIEKSALQLMNGPYAANQDETASRIMHAKTMQIPDLQRVFLFNQIGFPTEQFVNAPVFIVLTPKSTGDSYAAKVAWASDLNHYLFLHKDEPYVSLLRENGVLQWISHIEESAYLYERATRNYSVDLMTTVISTLIGVFTAIVIFISMNRMYFEEFRRKIFLYRLSGVSFFANHRRYIAVQCALFLLIDAVLWGLFKNMLVVSSVGLGFLFLSIGLLFWQMKRENRMAVTILKGE